MHRAEEDYIKAIYELTVEKGEKLIKVSELSGYLELTDQTVNEMVKKLVSKRLLEFLPYKGAKLTENGFSEAVRLIRAHRIWEVFLTEKLAYSWGEVHAEAERLEHATSPRLLERMDIYLKHPLKCAHGNPIPDKDGVVAPLTKLCLFELSPGERFTVARVIDNKELLSFLDKNAIKLEQKYTVKSKDIFAGLIEITGIKNHTLSRRVASMIFVEK